MTHILFYDNECGVCSHFIRFILKRLSSESSLYFAPRGGETFKKIIMKKRYKPIDSIYFYDGNLLYTRSKAVFLAFQHLKGFFGRLESLRKLPEPIIVLTDIVYDLFAKRRNNLSIKCIILSEDEKKRFLS